jgi:hypothetical protein
MTERMKLSEFKGGLFAGGKAGPQAIQPKEQTISKAIANFLDRKGVYNDRLNSGMFQIVTQYTERKTGTSKEFRRWVHGTRKGTPDRFAIIPAKYDPLRRGGLALFIEVKMKGKKPTPEQFLRHRELRAAGINAVDLFCGAGGTSTGLVIDAVNDLGYEIKLTAINHWDVAIATHSKNHEDVEHFASRSIRSAG